MLPPRPQWVPPGCKYALDFHLNRYWGGYVDVKANGSIDKGSLVGDDGTYASVPYTPTRSGVLYKGPFSGGGGNRITDLGIFAERVSTNYCLQSRNLTNASWTATNATVTQAGTTGADGSSATASKITATNSNATVYQTVTPSQGAYSAAVNFGGVSYANGNTITLTGGTETTNAILTVTGNTAGVITSVSVTNSGVYTAIPSNPVSQGSTSGSGSTATFNITWNSFVFSAWVKRITGTGAVYMTTNGGSNTYQIDGLINTSGYTWISGMAQTNGASTFSCGFELATNGDVIEVDFCQFEPAGVKNSNIWTNPAGAMPTSPLITTTGSVSRANEVKYFGNLSNINAGYAVMKNIFCNSGPSAMMLVWNGDATSNIPDGPATLTSDMSAPVTSSGGIGVGFDGDSSNATSNQGTNGRGNWNKSIFMINGAGRVNCLNGGTVSTIAAGSTNLPNINSSATHFVIGNNGTGTNDFALNGSMAYAFFWPQELTYGQMMEYSNLNSPYGNPYT